MILAGHLRGRFDVGRAFLPADQLSSWSRRSEAAVSSFYISRDKQAKEMRLSGAFFGARDTRLARWRRLQPVWSSVARLPQLSPSVPTPCLATYRTLRVHAAAVSVLDDVL